MRNVYLWIVFILLVASRASFASVSAPQQWRVSEFAFTAKKTCKNPSMQVHFSAVFTGPGGAKYEVPGFWDGGKTWKLRFTPTAPGKWCYTTRCPQRDKGLHGKKGSFTAAPAKGDNPLYHHGGGTPFFWLGDTWWFCPSDLVPFEGSSNPKFKSAYKLMVDTRKRQGFTVAQMAFMGSISGTSSFPDFSKTRLLDVKYWQQVDKYMDYANNTGIIPVIGLAFHKGMDLNTLDDWKVIWRYIIARYGAYAITWLICGEYNHDEVDNNMRERVPKALALGQFIKDTDPYKRAMTVHPWTYYQEKHQAWDQPWYDFIMLQGSHGPPPAVEVYLDAYRHKPTKPVLEGECRYEGIRGYTAADVRAMAYRAIQAGSFGYTYGSHGLWYPTQDKDDGRFDNWGERTVWWVALERHGAAQMQHLRACYESLQWWKLEPRPNAVKADKELTEKKRILTKAQGNKVFLIYFPQGLNPGLKAELTGLEAGTTYSGQWFDPRTGQMDNLSAFLKPSDSKLCLPDRKDNQDWLLILHRKKDE